MGTISAVAVAAIAFTASAEPSYVSELSFAKDNPTFDPHGDGTQIVGDVSVTDGGWLDFYGRSVVQTPNRADLNPGTADFTFGARLALTRGVGDWNVMQKGYWADPQWKLSTHATASGARLSCRFSGSAGAVQVFTDRPVLTKDGTWHDVACVREGNTVRVEVDGAVAAEGSGPIGSIVSTKPYLIGSKGMQIAKPDQYQGLLDNAFVIRDDNPTRPPPENHSPKADLTVVGCDRLACTFDATDSSDPDGDALQYSWNFGDGTTGSGSRPTHDFDVGGSYRVSVKVQDPDGASASAAVTVDVSANGPQVGFRDASGAVADAKAISVTIPTTVQAGDALLLLVTVSKSAPTIKAPGGWQALGREADDSMQTVLWSREATAADAGASVAVSSSGSAMMTADVLAYSSSGAAAPTLTAVPSAEDQRTATHVTPTTAVTSGDWVVSLWADRSAETTGWQPPPSVTVRQFLATTGAGHVTSLVADSGGPVGGATAGGLSATASAPSHVATMWTVVVSPA